MSDDYRQRFAADAVVLKAIGAALASQNTRLRVRLPADLAARALAAWQRDESGDLEVRSARERWLRDQAADLALIGLAIEQSAARSGDQVEVELDALWIAAALRAHYDGAFE